MAGNSANNDLRASAEAMACREVAKHLEGVERYLPKAAGRKEKKPKFVHQLRVESRRSAAALDLYADFLPVRQKAQLEKQLKKIRGAAGKARDMDVFIGLLTKDKTGQNSGALLKMARRQRKKAQADLVKARRSVTDANFADRVKKLLKDAERQAKAKRHSLHFSAWARLRLRPVVREFFDAVPPRDPGLKELHAFRIKSKELRYMMEMLETAFPSSFEKELLPRVESLQERLGEINDIAARRRRLRKWLSTTRNKAAALHLREHIALDTSRLVQARADFGAWCTPAFLQQLRTGFDAVLSGLSVVSGAARVS